MKQLLQNVRNGKTSIAEVPIPTPPSGMALVRVSASLVSAGTERMVVEFAEKSPYPDASEITNFVWAE